VGKRNFLGDSFLVLKLKDSSSVMCGGKGEFYMPLAFSEGPSRVTGSVDVLVVM
jgi:hypothetical protein